MGRLDDNYLYEHWKWLGLLKHTSRFAMPNEKTGAFPSIISRSLFFLPAQLLVAVHLRF